MPRGSVLRVALWIVSIVLILAVAAAFGYDWLLRGKYEPAIGEFQRALTANIDYFCEQQARLARDPWFHEPRTQGDAGPLLNAWLPWELQQDPPKDSPLSLPAHLPRSTTDFKDWLTSSVDVSGLDFEWMRGLHAYDRWDLSRNTPTPLPARIDFAKMPLPSFVPLMLWSKFRLLHGLRTGQPLEAAKDVRQLAWLSYRTDTLLGGAIAVALLRLEREAYDSLPSPPPEWRPWSQEQLDRMRAVTWSGTAFSHIAAPLEVAKQARSCGEPVVSRCAALTETGPMLKLVQPLVGDSYREVYEAFAADVADPACATHLPRTLWERGMTLDEQSRAGSTAALPAWSQSLPAAYLGSRIAGIIISTGLPSLRYLDELRAKPAPAGARPPRP
jgi:hypothetical protein